MIRLAATAILFGAVAIGLPLRPATADVLLTGDSIFAHWKTSSVDLEQRTINVAVGGARADDVVERLRTAPFDRSAVTATVLLVGVNNLGREKAPEVAEKVRAVAQTIRKDFPGPLFVVSLLPRGNYLSMRRPEIFETNLLLKNAAAGDGYRFIEVHAAFDSACAREQQCHLFRDVTHPNPDGYAVLAAALKPALAEVNR